MIQRLGRERESREEFGLKEGGGQTWERHLNPSPSTRRERKRAKSRMGDQTAAVLCILAALVEAIPSSTLDIGSLSSSVLLFLPTLDQPCASTTTTSGQSAGCHARPGPWHRIASGARLAAVGRCAREHSALRMANEVWSANMAAQPAPFPSSILRLSQCKCMGLGSNRSRKDVQVWTGVFWLFSVLESSSKPGKSWD